MPAKQIIISHKVNFVLLKKKTKIKLVSFCLFSVQLFLDDNIRNVAAGKAMGLRTVLVI